jgi:hypothetical protein
MRAIATTYKKLKGMDVRGVIKNGGEYDQNTFMHASVGEFKLIS